MPCFSFVLAALRRGVGRCLLLLAGLLAAAPLAVQAQTSSGSVGIGTTAPDVSAALDIVSSTKGALLPRVADATALATPATGLLVFQTGGTPGFYYNAGTPAAPDWQRLVTPVSGSFIQNGTTPQAGSNFNISGNGTVGGTLTATNAVVSTALTGNGASIGSAVGLGVRADGGLNIGQNTSGNNIYLGYLSGSRNTTGNNNLFGGYLSGNRNTTGSDNVFSGYQSGYFNTTGNYNVFTGSSSGFRNTDGRSNVFTGYQSGFVNTTGSYNVFTGYQSGLRNTDGSQNLFSGYQSGENNTSGNYNVFSGYMSGLFNTYGSFNVFSGSYSGFYNTGSFNVFSGYQSGYNTTGSQNLFAGHNSGQYNTAGSSNTALGYNSGPASGSGNLTNATALGANVTLTTSNTVVLGNGANVGIGTDAPGQKLEVAGGIKFTGTGSVLTFPDGTTQATAAASANLTGDITSTGAATSYNNVVPATKGGAGTVSGLLKADGAGQVSAAVAGTDYAAATGSAAYVQNTTTQQAGSNFNISGNGTVGGTLTAANVGIGTSSPNGQLANTSVNTLGILGATGQPAGGNGNSLNWAGSQAGYIGQFYNGGTTSQGNGVLVKIDGTDGGAIALDVSKGTQATAATPLLLVKASGNVGIGTSSPGSTLDVMGNAVLRNAQGSFAFHNYAPTPNGTILLGSFTGAGNNGPQLRFTGGGGNGPNDYLDLGQDGSGNFTLEMQDIPRLTVLGVPAGAATGYVGIGTSTPGQKLEVAGQVFSSSGGFRFPDNTVQTTAATTPPAITASNGLTRTANDLALGGTLTQNTTLTQNGNSLSLAGSPAAATISQPTSSGTLTISAGAGSDGQGQSFVLPAGATVTQVDVYGDGTGGTHTFTFYQGVPGGTVLGTQAVTYSPGQNLVSVVLTTPITVGAAGTYSFSTGSPNAFLVSYSNPYAGGTRFSGTTASASDDMKFTVYYTAPVSTLYASGSGQVGIGTSAPTQALQVAGQVFSSTGGFRFPDNTVQTTAASGTNFIQNTTTPQTASNFNVSGNGTVGGTLTATNLVVTSALTGSGGGNGSIGTVVGLGVRGDGGLNIGQNTSGNNIALGFGAGAVSTGVQNLFVGFAAGSGSTSGSSNVFSGYISGNGNRTGSYNTFEGANCGTGNTGGSYNAFFGASAGLNNTTGNNNTVVGAYSGPASGSGTLTNATALGANVTLTTDNTVVLGNGANVGIGTPAPAAGLHVLAGNNGVSSGTGVLISGPPTGTPNIELRGGSTAVTPYIDFAETNGVDYSTRLRSIGGVLNVEGNGSGGLLMRVNGNVQATNVTYTSDARFKQHVRPLTSALASVLALRGVRYEWNALGVRHGGAAGAPQVGLLAQEVEKIYPELVSTNADGYKAVNYAQLTPVLIEALKEQQAQIEVLKAEAAAAKSDAGRARADAARATATLDTFEARMRRLEAATGGQAQR